MAGRKTILTVIDPTAAEQPALRRAAWLAQALGAALDLFVCGYDQYLAGGRLFSVGGQEEARRKMLASHLAVLEGLRAPLLEQGLEVAIDARWGHPFGRVIGRKAVEAQPLVVVKDVGYPSGRRRALSNTDWSLIRCCPAPLLLVKPRRLGSPAKILAAVDPTHEHDKPAELDRAILSCAKELNTAIGGELHVVHAYDTTPALVAAADGPMATLAIPVAELTAGIESEHRQALQALLGGYPVDAANVHCKEGAAHRMLLETAEELRVDFLLMGAVSRGGLKRLFIGSTAERVVDRLPCDLFIIKPPGFEAPK